MNVVPRIELVETPAVPMLLAVALTPKLFVPAVAPKSLVPANDPKLFTVEPPPEPKEFCAANALPKEFMVPAVIPSVVLPEEASVVNEPAPSACWPHTTLLP